MCDYSILFISALQRIVKQYFLRKQLYKIRPSLLHTRPLLLFPPTSQDVYDRVNGSSGPGELLFEHGSWVLSARGLSHCVANSTPSKPYIPHHCFWNNYALLETITPSQPRAKKLFDESGARQLHLHVYYVFLFKGTGHYW